MTITYKKIKEGVFEKISDKERVEGIIKLEDIERTRDYYDGKFKEMDDLVKILEALNK